MVRWKIIGLTVILAASMVSCRFINSYAGPYIMYVTKMYDCKEEFVIPLSKLHLRFSNFNRFKPLDTQTVTGNLTMLHDLDDSYSVTIRWAKWANNEWKKNFLVLARLRGETCTTLRENAPNLYRTAFKHAKMTGPCVLSKGPYFYDKDPIDWTLPNFPVLPYGQYLLNATAFKRGSHRQFAACAEVTIVPKP